MAPSGTYHESQSTTPWQSSQPAFGPAGGRVQTVYNPTIGTPIPPVREYNNQTPYQAHHRESGIDRNVADRLLREIHKAAQGAQFNSQAGYSHGREHYSQQHVQGSGHEGSQPRPRSSSVSESPHEEQAARGGVNPPDQARCEGPFDFKALRYAQGGHGETCTGNTPETTRPTPSSLMRRGMHSSSSARTSSGGGPSRVQQSSLKTPPPVTHLNNSPTLLRTISSKSPPPYTLSQRKQLRVEEKSYLKEVKRSIAEGRVPQVRLLQNNSGDIIQYKSHFLNALKLAALSLVPNADIDVKNQSTMQEIMNEVKRQFIIEKPLPEGMVEGFLQRLYKRNRAVYHRHWTQHGDKSKPDDCTPAAWLQLVDYWKSREGSTECERNKANASAKKSDSVRYPTLITLCPIFAITI